MDAPSATAINNVKESNVSKEPLRVETPSRKLRFRDNVLDSLRDGSLERVGADCDVLDEGVSQQGGASGTTEARCSSSDLAARHMVSQSVQLALRKTDSVDGNLGRAETGEAEVVQLRAMDAPSATAINNVKESNVSKEPLRVETPSRKLRFRDNVLDSLRDGSLERVGADCDVLDEGVSQQGGASGITETRCSSSDLAARDMGFMSVQLDLQKTGGVDASLGRTLIGSSALAEADYPRLPFSPQLPHSAQESFVYARSEAGLTFESSAREYYVQHEQPVEMHNNVVQVAKESPAVAEQWWHQGTTTSKQEGKEEEEEEDSIPFAAQQIVLRRVLRAAQKAHVEGSEGNEGVTDEVLGVPPTALERIVETAPVLTETCGSTHTVDPYAPTEYLEVVTEVVGSSSLSTVDPYALLDSEDAPHLTDMPESALAARNHDAWEEAPEGTMVAARDALGGSAQTTDPPAFPTFLEVATVPGRSPSTVDQALPEDSMHVIPPRVGNRKSQDVTWDRCASGDSLMYSLSFSHMPDLSSGDVLVSLGSVWSASEGLPEGYEEPSADVGADLPSGTGAEMFAGPEQLDAGPQKSEKMPQGASLLVETVLSPQVTGATAEERSNPYASEDCILEGSFLSQPGFSEIAPFSSGFRWASPESPTEAEGAHVGLSGSVEVDMLLEADLVADASTDVAGQPVSNLSRTSLKERNTEPTVASEILPHAAMAAPNAWREEASEDDPPAETIVPAQDRIWMGITAPITEPVVGSQTLASPAMVTLSTCDPPAETIVPAQDRIWMGITAPITEPVVGSQIPPPPAMTTPGTWRTRTEEMRPDGLADATILSQQCVAANSNVTNTTTRPPEDMARKPSLWIDLGAVSRLVSDAADPSSYLLGSRSSIQSEEGHHVPFSTDLYRGSLEFDRDPDVGEGYVIPHDDDPSHPPGAPERMAATPGTPVDAPAFDPHTSNPYVIPSNSLHARTDVSAPSRAADLMHMVRGGGYVVARVDDPYTPPWAPEGSEEAAHAISEEALDASTQTVVPFAAVGCAQTGSVHFPLDTPEGEGDSCTPGEPLCPPWVVHEGQNVEPRDSLAEVKMNSASRIKQAEAAAASAAEDRELSAIRLQLARIEAFAARAERERRQAQDDLEAARKEVEEQRTRKDRASISEESARSSLTQPVEEHDLKKTERQLAEVQAALKRLAVSHSEESQAFSVTQLAKENAALKAELLSLKAGLSNRAASLEDQRTAFWEEMTTMLQQQQQQQQQQHQLQLQLQQQQQQQQQQQNQLQLQLQLQLQQQVQQLQQPQQARPLVQQLLRQSSQPALAVQSSARIPMTPVVHQISTPPSTPSRQTSCTPPLPRERSAQRTDMSSFEPRVSHKRAGTPPQLPVPSRTIASNRLHPRRAERVPILEGLSVSWAPPSLSDFGPQTPPLRARSSTPPPPSGEAPPLLPLAITPPGRPALPPKLRRTQKQSGVSLMWKGAFQPGDQCQNSSQSVSPHVHGSSHVRQSAVSLVPSSPLNSGQHDKPGLSETWSAESPATPGLSSYRTWSPAPSPPLALPCAACVRRPQEQWASLAPSRPRSGTFIRHLSHSPEPDAYAGTSRVPQCEQGKPASTQVPRSTLKPTPSPVWHGVRVAQEMPSILTGGTRLVRQVRTSQQRDFGTNLLASQSAAPPPAGTGSCSRIQGHSGPAMQEECVVEGSERTLSPRQEYASHHTPSTSSCCGPRSDSGWTSAVGCVSRTPLRPSFCPSPMARSPSMSMSMSPSRAHLSPSPSATLLSHRPTPGEASLSGTSARAVSAHEQPRCHAQPLSVRSVERQLARSPPLRSGPFSIRR